MRLGKDDNKRVLFISPAKTSALSKDGKPVQKLRTNMCLPACAILGALESAGFETHFVDAVTEGWNCRWMIGNSLIAYGLSNIDVVGQIAQIRPRYVLLTSMFSFEQCIVDSLVKDIKEHLPHIIVILGGIHATVRPEWHFEESCPDFIVLGEGEETIIELLEELDKEEPKPEMIQGIAFRNSAGEIVRTQPRGLLRSLDRTWSLERVIFKPDGTYRYLERFTRKSPIYGIESLGENVPTFALYGSRGCPMHCCYCSTSARDGTQIRHIGSSRMFHDFIVAREEYAIPIFYNQADTFGLHPEDLNFLRMVRDYRLSHENQPFVVNNPNAFFLHTFFPKHTDFELDNELVELLFEARINAIALAVETFNQRFNKKVNWSHIKPEQIFELCQVLHSRGIKTDIYLMYGFPGQTQQEFSYDVQMAERLLTWADSISWHFMTLFPGTWYYDSYVGYDVVKENEYRKLVRNGYSFFRPIDSFNLSRISTGQLEETVASFGQAWI